MNINHRPILNVRKAEQLYSEKDGVDVRYIATTALDTGVVSVDVFYRETPHPQFGNRYFGLFWHPLQECIVIRGADEIENLDFDMVEVNGQWHYSRDRHDYFTVGNVGIDGGRAYLRMVRDDTSAPVKTFRVKDGEFVEKETQ